MDLGFETFYEARDMIENVQRLPRTPEQEKYAYDTLARMFENWRERMKR